MLMLLLGAATDIIVAPVPKAATFGNWTVACDNVRHCEAFALPSEDASSTDSAWVLHVSRGADGAAAPKIESYPAFDDGDVVPARLRIDGRDTAFRLNGEGRAQGDGVTLLAAVAAARKVEVIDETGKVLAMIPVTGASAALRWIDDRQKRVGTVTAIVARGSSSGSAVSAPPVPRIAQPPASKVPPRRLRPADARAIQRLARGGCDPEQAKDVATYRLDINHTLGIVGCEMGAYQGYSVVVVIDESGHWTPATIEQPTAPDPQYADASDAYLLTSANFDAERRLLTMFSKDRGLTDCGETASWAWDGRMFRLASFQALHACLGAPPGMWPSLWQTANDPLNER